ncbi:methyltransferase domain-containing protein [Mesorhizobium sp. WSM2561]|uniref:class I SAM-dependent methyltransferase n=1 Tax=Mesorhizobium sp. WSM2561 TaxID=1040985 RepID=UPI00048228C8|nr:methyltransferase domain-containing protein [Mesorhizobium sp. WSM2561]
MNDVAIEKEKGRAAFGLDPAGYHQARPDYPEWVFEILRSRCGLGEGTSTFEIGAGTGKATRRMLESGANPLVAIEPDARLAGFLEEKAGSPALRVVNSAFEDAVLARSSFDLGTSATAFHWVNEADALQRIVDALRVGGWWAPFWNIFGDPDRDDPFHEATKVLLSDGPANPSNSDSSNLEFGADKVARLAALEAAQAFDMIGVQASTWSIELDPDQTMQLYSSYSNVTLRPDRERVIGEIGRIAQDEFGGRVTRNMTTILYVARRAV